MNIEYYQKPSSTKCYIMKHPNVIQANSTVLYSTVLIIDDVSMLYMKNPIVIQVKGKQIS